MRFRRVKYLLKVVSGKPFLKRSSRKVFHYSLLTGIIVFCTALATNIGTVDLTRLVLVSAGLSGVAAFCQTILEFWKDEES